VFDDYVRQQKELGQRIVKSDLLVDANTEHDVARVCPYCTNAYMGSVVNGVSTCSRCGNAHAYSGPRDTDKYGPLPFDDSPSRHTVLEVYDGDEWYTPMAFIEAARALMDDIDLDPATCPTAQARIQATNRYFKDDDGLGQEWYGRVWCNPPYSYPLIEQFTQKAIAEREAGHITQGLLLVNNCTDAAWFVALAERFPVMFTKGRAKFWQADQRTFATRQGQALFYMGDDIDAFHRAFQALAYAPIGRGCDDASRA